jgi:hypothetical protein
VTNNKKTIHVGITTTDADPYLTERGIHKKRGWPWAVTIVFWLQSIFIENGKKSGDPVIPKYPGPDSNVKYDAGPLGHCPMIRSLRQ